MRLHTANQRPLVAVGVEQPQQQSQGQAASVQQKTLRVGSKGRQPEKRPAQRKARPSEHVHKLPAELLPTRSLNQLRSRPKTKMSSTGSQNSQRAVNPLDTAACEDC